MAIKTCQELEYLASGAYGNVYKIKNQELVIKHYKKQKPDHEAMILKKLSDVNGFPKLIETNEDGLIMTYIKGMKLSELIRTGYDVSPSVWKQIKTIYQQTLQKGVLPVDVNLHNILLNEETGKVGIIDVGNYQIKKWENHKEKLTQIRQLTISYSNFLKSQIKKWETYRTIKKNR